LVDRSVLVAEQLAASGAELLISVTSAGQIADLPATPCFVLIDRALRDEGTMKNALAATITTLPGQLRRSLTWDCGKEMSAHAQSTSPTHTAHGSAGVGPQIRRARLGNWQARLWGPLNGLRAIFLTHLHSDHVCDLNNILDNGHANGLGLGGPVTVWGPGDQRANLGGEPPPAQHAVPGRFRPGADEVRRGQLWSTARRSRNRYSAGSPEWTAPCCSAIHRQAGACSVLAAEPRARDAVPVEPV
jgi:glyoxylase-like metal-dependent hydrolase (beta-lactamase superfamily II)